MSGNDALDSETIEIKSDTWVALNARRAAGESFDDVVRRLIDDSPHEMGTLESEPPDPMAEPTPVITEEQLQKGCIVHRSQTDERCGRTPTHIDQLYVSHEDTYLSFPLCEAHAEGKAVETWIRVLNRLICTFQEGKRQHERRSA